MSLPPTEPERIAPSNPFLSSLPYRSPLLSNSEQNLSWRPRTAARRSGIMGLDWYRRPVQSTTKPSWRDLHERRCDNAWDSGLTNRGSERRFAPSHYGEAG